MSINLIPPKIKAEQHAQKTGALVTYVLFMIFSLLTISTIAVVAANQFLNVEIKRTDSKISNANNSLAQYKDLETSITSTNKKIDSLSKADSERVLWSNILTELSSITPNTLQIKTLNLSSDTKKISLTGVAASRTNIATLKDNMENSSKFKNVTFSSSTLEDSGSFTYNMSCELEEIK